MSRIDRLGARLAARPRARGALAAVIVAIPLVVIVMVGFTVNALARHDPGSTLPVAFICGLVLLDAALCGGTFGRREEVGVRPRRGHLAVAMALIAVVAGDTLFVLAVSLLSAIATRLDDALEMAPLLAYMWVIGLFLFGLPALVLAYPHARAWDALTHRWKGLST